MSLIPVGRAQSIFCKDITLKQRIDLAQWVKHHKDLQIFYEFVDNPMLGTETQGGMVCRAGKTRCTITSDGVVLPCDCLRDLKFHAGNIKTQTFSEIWNTSPVFTHLRNLDAKAIPKCAECTVNDCEGGCRAVSYGVYGDEKRRDPRCCR